MTASYGYLMDRAVENILVIKALYGFCLICQYSLMTSIYNRL